MKAKFLFFLLIIAGGIAGWLYYQKHSAGVAENAPLKFYGNVDIREVNLGFRVAGKIAEIFKDEGDTVAAGELLARLDDAPYASNVAQAQAALAAGEAELQRAVAGFRVEEIAQARALVNQRIAELENAKSIAERYKTLVPTNAISKQQYDDAETARIAVEKQLDSAKASLALFEAGTRVEDIERAKAQVAQFKAALETVRIQLSDTKLFAPSAGTIITRAQEPGAIVAAGATVLTLSLDKPVWVRAYVAETDLDKVAPGTPVNVFIDSRPEKPYAGKIGYVSPRSEFTPKTVQTESLRTSLVYRVRITIDAPEGALRQGMPVTVKLAK